MKTKAEIIKETREYYQQNDRAIKGKGCYYYLDGKMCAVGRCLIDAKSFEGFVEENYSDYTNWDKLSRDIEDIESYIKPEYRGHEPKFWVDLQAFHDDLDEQYWHDKKLTEAGKAKYQFLLKKWS